MINPIKKLFSEISDKELKSSILEIQESDTTGYVKEDGIVRKYARLSGELTGGFTTTDFNMVIIHLLKQAAFRWVENKNIV